MSFLPVELSVDPGLIERILHMLAVLVFALSGALAAAAKRQTFVTFVFFALITGVGGGTVRDIMIGAPVFWMRDGIVPLLCLAAALLVWLLPNRIWKPRALDWFDAVGLAAYSVFGAAKALSWGIEPIAASLMGIITACIGGIIRDTLAGEPSILMKPELYVSASALAAGSFVLLLVMGVWLPVASIVAFLLGFGLRGFAIWKGLALPSYAGTGEENPD